MERIKGLAIRDIVDLLVQRGFNAIVDCHPATPTRALVYGVRPT